MQQIKSVVLINISWHIESMLIMIAVLLPFLYFHNSNTKNRIRDFQMQKSSATEKNCALKS